jgi:formylglycine-generating enzyme
MKHFTPALALVALLLMSFISVKKPKDDKLTVKEIESSVVKLSDNLYAGKFEVSNRLYLLFIKSLEAANSASLMELARLDTLNWRDPLAYNEPYVDYYFRHPAYANYPVVNVSYMGATLFCEWLTFKYNMDAKRKYKKVQFRLPTESEWVTAAQGGRKTNTYSWGMNLMKDGLWAGNFHRIRNEGVKYDSIKKEFVVDKSHKAKNFEYEDAADITAPIDAYKPNGLGIFNACGNVAEMISEKGIACGGGWRSHEGDIRIDSRMHYTKSASDIGFRYFMEIVEE